MANEVRSVAFVLHQAHPQCGVVVHIERRKRSLVCWCERCKDLRAYEVGDGQGLIHDRAYRWLPKEARCEMIKVWVGVSKGAESFAVAVYAGSIGRALQVAKAHYPDSHVRMIFPIQPDDFFLRESDVDALGPTAKPKKANEIIDIEPSGPNRGATYNACIGLELAPMAEDRR